MHNDVLHGKSLNQNKVIKFTESVSEYLSLNGANRSITFEKAVQRASRYLVGSVGDKDLKSYTRANANSKIVRLGIANQIEYCLVIF